MPLLVAVPAWRSCVEGLAPVAIPKHKHDERYLAAPCVAGDLPAVGGITSVSAASLVSGQRQHVDFESPMTIEVTELKPNNQSKVLLVVYLTRLHVPTPQDLLGGNQY